MMGGGAFILLKVGHPWPETAKQPEIRLANLLKILRIAGFGGENTSQGGKGHAMVVFRDFRGTWLI
jgi:hypothetical protein